MIKTIKVTDVARAAASLAPRRSYKSKKIIQDIIKSIQSDGDAAVRRYEKKFGNAAPRSLKVSKEEIARALSHVTVDQVKAVRLAKTRLEKTESAIMSLLKDRRVSFGKTKVAKRFVPLQSVGCYVPGGLARYPSSVVMSVVPARIAGVRRIAVVSPPGPDGKIDPLTVTTARICGATEIYKTGGAQAIAALSIGTKSIPRVDKIVGPGGQFVTHAKYVASRHTPIDMLAGPTELGILADDSADPTYVALDLISQSEHSRDTRCYLVTDSPNLAESVTEELRRLASHIQRRKIVCSSLQNNGFVAVCKSPSQATKLVDLLAPEHLQIMTKNPQRTASLIHSPGLVLLGDQSPSAASDYLLGSNHILPTECLGRTRGSLSVLDFVKLHTEVTASKAALAEISEEMRILTGAEGLSNHYEAVRGRLQ